MKLILIMLTVSLVGCVCLNPDHRRNTPPSVDTGKVIQDLKETKEELIKAGEANTAVGKSVDKALSLAEKLDQILEQIEKEEKGGK